jgi:cell wall-associated NlpC family hydrolase
MSNTGMRPGEANQETNRNPFNGARVAEPVSVGDSEVAQRTRQAGVRVKDTNSRLLDAAVATRKKKQELEAAKPKPSSFGGGGSSQQFAPSGNIGGTRGQIIGEASSYLGNSYVMGGNTHQGIDCSGLVQQVYKKFGFNLPRLAAQQGAAMPGVRTAVTNLKPGDLVVWRDGSHIAIYAGNGEIIQAANPNQGVIRSRLTNQVGYTPGSVFGIAVRFPGE